MYKILLTSVCYTDNQATGIATTVLEFDTKAEADFALARLQNAVPTYSVVHTAYALYA